MLFNKVLIANRGEIACRVAKTATRMGIKTVGVYSEADKYAMHAMMCDQSFLIGPPKPIDSYLVVDHYIQVATDSKSQAVHPGYGFLSENASFVQKLQDKGIVFVGPPAEAIQAMGSKAESKRIMEAAGVPLVPGYHGESKDPNVLLAEAKKIGFPVMLKASLGGGGKGMRIVRSESEFMSSLEAAKNESRKGFNDDHMIIEKYIERPRHIEVQVFGDKHGNYVYLNERDCTVQRRHQKVIEEAPADISAPLRLQIGEAAVAAAKAVGYYNAGTVEFIFDTTDDKFYFMEMNTRLQVEHPVTEMITGLDLVEWQLRVAAGEELPIKSQIHVPLLGHAIEARVYAEDPDNGFLPQSGKINVLREPVQGPNLRIDTGIRQGDQITTFYDPMISKVIVHAETRDQAIFGLQQALNDYQVIGLPTNIKFLQRVLNNSVFKKGVFDTSFIEQNQEQLLKPSRELSLYRRGTVAIVKVFLENLKYRTRRDSDIDPWAQRDLFRVNHNPMREIVLVKDDHDEGSMFVQYINENTFNVFSKDENGFLVPVVLDAECHMSDLQPDQVIVRTDHHLYQVDYFMDPKEHNVVTQLDYEGDPLKIKVKKTELIRETSDEGERKQSVKSPMPGTVVKVFCSVGQEVKAGEPLVSIESMKMEYLIKATHDCVVGRVDVKEGAFVEMKQELVALK